MLIKLTSQNCAFFVKSRKILLIFLFFPPRLVWHHSSTTFPQQVDSRHPRGRGCSLCPWPLLALKLLGVCSRSCQGGLAEPFPAAEEELCKAEGLWGVLYQHTQVMKTGHTRREWPGQAGPGVSLLIPVSEVEHQGYRGCRPTGRPNWGRGRWRKNESSFFFCSRIMLSSMHSDQSSPQPYKIALALSQVVLLNYCLLF